MYKYYFEKLDVWQLSKDLIKSIYRLTSGLPGSEKYGLISQTQRASVSIASNIAEGSARITAKDQANFTMMAYSSAMELLSLLIVANELGFLSDAEDHELRTKIDAIAQKLNVLRKAQLSNN